jgi:hypothetical protein
MLAVLAGLPPFPIVPAAADDSVGWISVCPFSHRLRADPIVSPGTISMHLHDFFGSKSTNANSTYKTLLAHGTTCAIRRDKAAYWIPSVELKTSGKKVHPNAANFYYRDLVYPRRSVRAYPPALKVVAGNHDARAPQPTSIVYWGCDGGSKGGGFNHPVRCGTGFVTAHINFPDCWDGVHTDSADHKSHMAYSVDPNDDGKRSCPRKHPVPVPRLIYTFRWPIHNGRNIKLSSGPYYTLHGDFFNAWVQSKLRTLVRNCIRASRNCGKPGT